MKFYYKTDYALRASDFDMNRKIKISSVLDLFQSAAGAHSDIMGCGFYDLLPKDMLWVLTKTRYVVRKSPSVYEKVSVETWPLVRKGVTYRREYRVTGENSEVYILGTSEWVIMNLNTRKLDFSGNAYPEGEFMDELSYPEEKIRKVFVKMDNPYSEKAVPAFCDIDSNKHVNNIHYARYCQNMKLPYPVGEVSEFAIDYHKELLPSDECTLFASEIDGKIHYHGESSTGENIFDAMISYNFN